MMREISRILLFALICVNGLSRAQEGLTHLSCNLQYMYGDLRLVDKAPLQPGVKGRPASHTLPFTDDFYYAGRGNPYPDPTKWDDKNVYVNTGFPIAPPSVGVATFDGLNTEGYPYFNPGLPNLNASGPADTLTSADINLFTGALSQTFTPADSIGLSFYCQPRGYGEAPEAIDSLILDLYKPAQKTWQSRVWFSRGISNANIVDTSFKRVFVWLKDTAYLHDKFKFRIRNKATNTGNFDHWHVDYVYLNSGRSMLGDTLYNDVTFATTPTTFLKDYYAMPYEQYQPSDMAKNNSVRIKNNYNQAVNIFYNNDFYLGSTKIYTYSAQADNIPPFKTNGYFNKQAFCNPASHPTFTFSYPFPLTDSTDFVIQHYISRSGADFIQKNDTVYQYQKFRNYYALDDGSAELGYYVLGTNAQMVMKIKTNVSDTLQALRVYFDPAPIASATKFYFKIRIYTDDNGPGNVYYAPDNLYYPQFIDSAGFKPMPEYKLPVPIVLPAGTYYIGIQQQLSTGLVVGWDNNQTSYGNMFFNTGSNWQMSGLRGALMMRPVFGKRVPSPVGINENLIKTDVAVYPNPATTQIFVSANGLHGSKYTLLNMMGQTVKRGMILTDTQTISTEGLETGLYILNLSNKGKMFPQQKIVIQN